MINKNRIDWIFHDHKKILFLDFSNAAEIESTKVWKDAEPYILSYDGQPPLLVLLDVLNVRYNRETQNVYRDIRNKSKNIPQKWAIANANPATKLMIKIICIFIKDNIFFVNSIDEGKALLSQ